jgi:hypothetical protein
MDAQTFMYWALGGGFILIVVFLCVAMFYLIRILRDFSDASESVKETAEKMNENVLKIADKVTVVAEQLTDSLVRPLTWLSFFTDKIRPMIDMVQRKAEEVRGALEEDDEEDEKPKKKRHFGRKKK